MPCPVPSTLDDGGDGAVDIVVDDRGRISRIVGRVTWSARWREGVVPFDKGADGLEDEKWGRGRQQRILYIDLLKLPGKQRAVGVHGRLLGHRHGTREAVVIRPAAAIVCETFHPDR